MTMNKNGDAPAEDGAANCCLSFQQALIINIVNMLGGRANIVDVDACMTRLRVTVKDAEKSEQKNNDEGAMVTCGRKDRVAANLRT